MALTHKGIPRNERRKVTFTIAKEILAGKIQGTDIGLSKELPEKKGLEGLKDE